jgi:hypothetical protein
VDALCEAYELGPLHILSEMCGGIEPPLLLYILSMKVHTHEIAVLCVEISITLYLI